MKKYMILGCLLPLFPVYEGCSGCLKYRSAFESFKTTNGDFDKSKFTEQNIQAFISARTKDIEDLDPIHNLSYDYYKKMLEKQISCVTSLKNLLNLQADKKEVEKEFLEQYKDDIMLTELINKVFANSN